MALWGAENVEARESSIQGTGVFATKDFHADELIYQRDETRLVTLENPINEAAREFSWHCTGIGGGRVILLPTPDRYVNHSCDPNCFTVFIDGAGFKRALRDVRAGDELTSDYSINNFDEDVRCECGAAQCRGIINADFFQLPPEKQIEYLPRLSKWFVTEHDKEVGQLRRRASLSQ